MKPPPHRCGLATPSYPHALSSASQAPWSWRCTSDLNLYPTYETPTTQVWFGIPELPTRPELSLTSPLVMAVRMGRAECVEQLVQLSTSLSVPDAFYLTPVQYAMLLLVK